MLCAKLHFKPSNPQQFAGKFGMMYIKGLVFSLLLGNPVCFLCARREYMGLMPKTSRPDAHGVWWKFPDTIVEHQQYHSLKNFKKLFWMYMLSILFLLLYKMCTWNFIMTIVFLLAVKYEDKNLQLGGRVLCCHHVSHCYMTAFSRCFSIHAANWKKGQKVCADYVHILGLLSIVPFDYFVIFETPFLIRRSTVFQPKQNSCIIIKRQGDQQGNIRVA